MSHPFRNEQVRSRYLGREVNRSGDGFLALFDGARAVRCARAIGERLTPLGLENRCGIHTGEVEVMGSDIAGLAVHIGARIAALAAPGEVLVSPTVRDLVAGAGLRFLERGAHALRGVPDTWEVYALGTREGLPHPVGGAPARGGTLVEADSEKGGSRESHTGHE